MDNFIFFQEKKEKESKELAIKNISLPHTRAKLCASLSVYKTRIDR